MEKIVCIIAALACSCTNGITIPDQTDRITGGNIANQQQFPYAISLQQVSLLPEQVQAHRCGGALITYQHALTAAQCTYYIDVNLTVTNIEPSQYRVFAGDVLLSNDNETERVRTVANVTVHPDHLIYPALLHDIAVITLSTPFLNTTVVPIPIAVLDSVPADFTLCSLSGWGGTLVTTANASNALRYATKFTYNHSLCTSLYSSFIGTINIHPTMLCAASYDIYSVGCTGDEGNALVCNGELTGILSLTNQCLMTSYPEVYTRVSNYTQWIRGVTGGSSSFKPQLGLFAVAAVVLATMFS